MLSDVCFCKAWPGLGPSHSAAHPEQLLVPLQPLSRSHRSTTSRVPADWHGGREAPQDDLLSLRAGPETAGYLQLCRRTDPPCSVTRKVTWCAAGHEHTPREYMGSRRSVLCPRNEEGKAGPAAPGLEHEATEVIPRLLESP